MKLPFDFGQKPEHARQRHQYDSHQYPTSYVSTTPRSERAEYYARYSDPDRGIVATKTIVTIDTTRFDALGISAHPVADDFELFQISKPEDHEIILEYRGGHEFPKDVIIEVRKL
jgi:hypothetical protein